MGGALSSPKGLFYDLFLFFLIVSPLRQQLCTQAIERTDAPNATFVKNKIFFKNNFQASRFFWFFFFFLFKAFFKNSEGPA